ncbi:hypothetical protein DFA_08362 [Cavenderia fasciculata]|uniref:Uncharacterized protein n=1 Tax=Cavenderia fasciculata TaxID=261658 RepID=F4Q5V8_CACFS|nr:uncharacterized protein DFA_08362 [Cavenderia fasciculata]EGG17367.1 hypothetical protein DFA_08362 [Cavenderia fasciculata]|eukprot:XP_004355851.1 hypothetical protein DFA_08362 [Cavenderia fasciculata]
MTTSPSEVSFMCVFKVHAKKKFKNKKQLDIQDEEDDDYDEDLVQYDLSLKKNLNRKRDHPPAKQPIYHSQSKPNMNGVHHPQEQVNIKKDNDYFPINCPSKNNNLIGKDKDINKNNDLIGSDTNNPW